MYSGKTTTLKDKSAINLICIAVLTAKKAGDAIMEIYGSDYEIDYKDDKSPLTLADRRSHEVILRSLHSKDNKISDDYNFPILSEEGKDISYEVRKEWQYFWLVDPLDGTKEFIKRNDEFTVNIALINKNRPVIGVVYTPVKETFYFAVEGMGAYKLNNNRPLDSIPMLSNDTPGFFDTLLKDSTRLPLENSDLRTRDSIAVVGSRSHATMELEVFVENLKNKHEKVDFVSAGSSLKFCFVAEGKADIYPRLGPTMEWDTAAGQCIVEESGGSVISVEDKTSLSYNKRDLKNGYFLCTGKSYGNLKIGKSRRMENENG